VGNMACKREMRGVYVVLVGKPKRMRPLGKSRCKWKNNIKIYIPEILWHSIAGGI
jgi:hypothetical protein